MGVGSSSGKVASKQNLPWEARVPKSSAIESEKPYETIYRALKTTVKWSPGSVHSILESALTLVGISFL